MIPLTVTAISRAKTKDLFTLAIELPPLPAGGLSLTVRTISPRFCLNLFTCVFDGESLGFFGARGLRGLGGFSGSFFRFFGTPFFDVEPVGVGVNSSSSRDGDCEACADGISDTNNEGPNDSSSELSSLYIGEFTELVPPFLPSVHIYRP
jgi:hypothetical protein